jgi:ribosomal protein L4
MTAPAKPGAALTATLNANEKRYARTSAARNRARQRECVDGDEHTPDELREIHAALKAECRLRHPEWFR